LQSIDFSQVLIGFAILLVSLTVHEAAHAWTSDRLGDPTARLLGRVSLNPAVHVDPIGTVLFPLLAVLANVPLIGWARPVPVNPARLRHPRRDYVYIAAAGPLSNLALAGLVSVVASVLGLNLWQALGQGEGGGAAIFLVQAIYINVFLAVFNLLPVPPLDGGNVLAGLLPPRAAAQFDRLRQWGFLILYALILTGVLSTVVMPIAATIVRWLL
jgi:Zn-dependent protease